MSCESHESKRDAEGRFSVTSAKEGIRMVGVVEPVDAHQLITWVRLAHAGGVWSWRWRGSRIYQLKFLDDVLYNDRGRDARGDTSLARINGFAVPQRQPPHCGACGAPAIGCRDENSLLRR
jgi:hypothetical protein